MTNGEGEMDERITQVLTDLDRLRAHLGELPEGIWQQINYRDRAAREAGMALLNTYEEKVQAFGQLADELAALLRQLPGARATPVDPPPGPSAAAAAAPTGRPHRLGENFTHTKPSGLVLLGIAYDVRSWRDLYLLVCRTMAQRDPARFQSLAHNPEFTSRVGNPAFAGQPDGLRESVEVVPGTYAEINLSAHSVCDYTKRLLEAFDVDPDTVQIYLRGDGNMDASEDI
jgi:hypothetical protein